MDMVRHPAWRKVDKNKWMDKNNQFYAKKCDKPVWDSRGIGHCDGGAEPHIIDDLREFSAGKSKTEKKSLISPT